MSPEWSAPLPFKVACLHACIIGATKQGCVQLRAVLQLGNAITAACTNLSYNTESLANAGPAGAWIPVGIFTGLMDVDSLVLLHSEDSINSFLQRKL